MFIVAMCIVIIITSSCSSGRSPGGNSRNTSGNRVAVPFRMNAFAQKSDTNIWDFM